MGYEDSGQAAMDGLRRDASEIAQALGLDARGVDTILGPARGPTTRAIRSRAESPDALGVAYETARATLTRLHDRKAAGRYYTPAALVVPTVERTLGPLDVTHDDFAVCDPAAGGGAFLLAAMRVIAAGLVARDPTACRRAARRRALGCVHGVDLDPFAARVARLSLWLEAADPNLDPRRAIRQVRVADACVIDWQAEFAELFTPNSDGGRSGFDAIVGNPPWNIDKPDSRQFFATVDPDYPRHTKQRALEVQRQLLDQDPELARRWHQRKTAHAEFSAWLRSTDSPFWRQGRGDGNHYKLFTELAWNLVRNGGRIGLIVPSGLYTDAGAKQLREMLLNESEWEWLFSFENRDRVFAIDNRFKFAVVIAKKGGTTQSIRTAFLRTNIDDWRTPRGFVELSRAQIEASSPRSLAIPEIRNARDAQILEQISATSTPLGDALDDKTLRYRRELDLTQQSHRFPTRDDWEARGYRPSTDGQWLKCQQVAPVPTDRHSWTELLGERPSWVHEDQIEDVALPLYEGRMIGQFDSSERGWVEGRGRRAKWHDLPFRGASKPIEPQYLLSAKELELVDPDCARPKLGFMSIASATNRRSMVATALLDAPCGNSVPTLRGIDAADDLRLLAVLNSFVFDWALRLRLGGVNLNRFVLADCPMLRKDLRADLLGTEVAAIVAALCWTSPQQQRAWQAAGLRLAAPALDLESRAQRRAVLDAVIASAYDLDEGDFNWILRGVDHSCKELRDKAVTRQLDQKGFWRVDRELPREARQSIRALRAFRELNTEIRNRGSHRAGIVSVCARFPETVGQRCGTGDRLEGRTDRSASQAR